MLGVECYAGKSSQVKVIEAGGVQCCKGWSGKHFLINYQMDNFNFILTICTSKTSRMNCFRVYEKVYLLCWF